MHSTVHHMRTLRDKIIILQNDFRNHDLNPDVGGAIVIALMVGGCLIESLLPLG
jgi:hypothetical protein